MFFDVVLVIDVFEHVEDYMGFLRKIRDAGKYKIFHIPLDLSVQMVLRSKPIIKQRKSVGHLHYFTKETAMATLQDTGYRVVDSFYTNGSLEKPNRGLFSLLMAPIRKVCFALNKDLAVRMLGGCSLLVLTE